MTGGAATTWACVTSDVLDARAIESRVAHPEAGATVVFVGAVRDHDGGRGVSRLDYEAHPKAERVLARLVADSAARPGVVGVAAAHRVGALEVGDAAVVVAVSSAHRAEAFEACSALIEALKSELPVWKNQFFVDGSSEWVNSL